MFVRIIGPIAKAIATEKYLPVIRQVAVKEPALHWQLIFQVFTVRKKTCMFRVYTVESTLGWACLISTVKGHLSGAMEHLLTFIIGRNTSQTTFTMRIVFTFLGSFKTTSMNGTISTAQPPTDFLAGEVTFMVKKTTTFFHGLLSPRSKWDRT